jgi:hypothetical protein
MGTGISSATARSKSCAWQNLEQPELYADVSDIMGEVSAYVDGELKGERLTAFEALLAGDALLRAEADELKRLGGELSKLGEHILTDPVPVFLLDALSPPKCP